jgi:hypothetical protein
MELDGHIVYQCLFLKGFHLEIDQDTGGGATDMLVYNLTRGTS